MAINNFKCPETGKEFFIPSHKSILTNGSWVYKDRYNKEIVNPENQQKLIPIKKEGSPMFMPSTKDRMARNEKYFKERAKKHANSDEEKDRKKRRFKTEIDTVTGKSKS